MEKTLLEQVARTRKTPFYRRLLGERPCASRAEFQELPLSGSALLGPSGRQELRRSQQETAAFHGAQVFLESFLSAQEKAIEFFPGLPVDALGDRSFEETEQWRSESLLDGHRALVRSEARGILAEALDLVVLADAALPPATKTPIEHILVSGLLPAALRTQLEEDWQASVREICVLFADTLLGVGCEEGSLHLANELFLVEILEVETGVAVPPGAQGRLVVTSLEDSPCPLIRWDTGELVELATAACACGRPDFPVRRLGRVEDVVRIGGREALPVDIFEAAQSFVRTLGSRVFFAVVSPTELRLLIEVADISRPLPAQEYMELRRGIGLPMDVRLLPTGTIRPSRALNERSPMGLSRLADWEWATGGANGFWQRLRQPKGERLLREALS